MVGMSESETVEAHSLEYKSYLAQHCASQHDDDLLRARLSKLIERGNNVRTRGPENRVSERLGLPGKSAVKLLNK